MTQRYKNPEIDADKINEHSTTWKISLTIPDRALDLFQRALEPVVDALSTQEHSGHWLVRGYVINKPSHSTVSSILGKAASMASIQMPLATIEELRDHNWAQESVRNLQPVHVGRFVVRGSHSDSSKNPTLIELKVDAGAAFGTGHHATTKGCLRALSELLRLRAPVRALDIGCGAGTLAMGIARLWKVKTIASDIDPIAVHVARANVSRNHLHTLVQCVASNGTASPMIRQRVPFDLIVANILLRPLVRLAPSIAQNLSPAATVVLSGVLDEQAASIVAIYREQGLHLKSRFSIDGWTTVIMTRPRQRAIR